MMTTIRSAIAPTMAFQFIARSPFRSVRRAPAAPRSPPSDYPNRAALTSGRAQGGGDGLSPRRRGDGDALRRRHFPDLERARGVRANVEIGRASCRERV